MAVSADLYRTFLGVGLYLSFSRAAKELGVSQSSMEPAAMLRTITSKGMIFNVSTV